LTTLRERNEAKRAQKLREIDDAVAQGRLVIRPMTAAERKRFPPRTQGPQRATARRRGPR
jgi:hypothetical protein